jgi:hypothetical protein
MGKEYRIFFEAAVGFDVWTEISKYKKNFSADRLGEEKRTDNYIDINCADFGLKFRGGNNGLLELKTKESDYFGVEKWTKKASSAKSNEDVIPTLKKFALTLPPSLKAKLEECISNLEGKSIDKLTFTFKKSRKSTSFRLSDLAPNDPQANKIVSIEQVNIELEHDGKSLGSWRSVCFEGKKKSMLSAANILLSNVPNKITASYPGFIIHLQSRE